MKKIIRILALSLVLAVCSALLPAAPVLAEEEDGGIMGVKLSMKPTPLDASVETGIDHLFDVLHDPAKPFDQSQVRAMLDFVTTMQDDPKDIEPARRFGGLGVCLRKEVPTSLETILRYFYNPDIPNFLLCPAVLRLSGWREGSEFLTRGRTLWDELPTLDAPVLVRGREFEVNTPDSFAEAYYRYDLERLIILLKHDGKNVAISISEQPEQSDVGRKGAILDDQQWDYFYSGIEGLNKGMIGWMDTFMYRSGSVQVFTEHDAVAPRSSVFLFKWLKAGWAGMNVVKRSHIYDGSLRYARSFSTVLESASLTPDEVAAGMRAVAALPKAEVDAQISEYARNFEIRFKDNPKLQKKEYASVIADGRYGDVLDADARRSVLALQKLKCLIGMDALLDMCASPVASTTEPAKPEPTPGS
ncbi:MAG: hypothetical protein KUA35_06950 [Pseudodesulfovibrio sp.]|uniref:Uncharacterized protein n=1 Tax=Pseudodesulfovibrio aespoeensis (strain ATCC 700646 / DSM 10631 / Aspo-2) TaxID=643562 RepID=E6VZC2_PSEA9|nr:MULTISPECIES: hypothetical protein [Pseudodesulfovibrio]MBU4190832.1 hypothetical protein [Pseudomonadota bacterium]ADU63994.1 hypothetical protein Daes_3001 [Pseudodesulfovibrio aespoeensis Aspo-2]MBU4243867.1 hypothetical protein [Pseudomonadota bacterium]MBU4377506.1 hypothetical protein [Pseudomonadota bacterium]MBU4475393.1 hypothetical protein [Pseudomonadota bacterium]